MPETVQTVVGRIDERLIAVERDVRAIKDEQRQQRVARPTWPTILSSMVATAALLIVLIQII